MASLKQNIKTLLTDVERFLAETLKHVKLDRAAVSSKEKLLERVRQLLDDVMGPSNSSTQLDGINASGGSFVTSGGSSDSSSSNLQHSTSEEPSYSDDISKIASSELKDVFQAGLLDKKKKSGLKTWEQMYCVVSKNIFYLYKKQSDSKQKEAFCLTGYEFHEAPSLEKDANKKEMCFELTKVGSSTYQFRAASKDAVLIWKEAINKGISTVVDTHVIGEGPQVKRHVSFLLDDNSDDEVYDVLDCDSHGNNDGGRALPPLPPSPPTSLSPSSPPPTNSFYENTGKAEDAYENSHLEDYVPTGQAPPPPSTKNASLARNFFQAKEEKSPPVLSGSTARPASPKYPTAKGDLHKASEAAVYQNLSESSAASPTALKPLASAGRAKGEWDMTGNRRPVSSAGNLTTSLTNESSRRTSAGRPFSVGSSLASEGKRDPGKGTTSASSVSSSNAKPKGLPPPLIDIFKDCNPDEMYDDAGSVPGSAASVKDRISASKWNNPIPSGVPGSDSAKPKEESTPTCSLLKSDPSLKGANLAKGNNSVSKGNDSVVTMRENGTLASARESRPGVRGSVASTLPRQPPPQVVATPSRPLSMDPASPSASASSVTKQRAEASDASLAKESARQSPPPAVNVKDIRKMFQ